MAADSSPQGALELLNARDTLDNGFHVLISTHVPDNVKHAVWVNKYVDFHKLSRSRPH